MVSFREILFGAGAIAVFVSPLYVSYGVSTGHWSIPKQIAYERRVKELMPEVIKLVEQDGSYGITSHEEVIEFRRRAGLDTNKSYVWFTPESMERVIVSYKTDLNKEGQK